MVLDGFVVAVDVRPAKTAAISILCRETLNRMTAMRRLANFVRWQKVRSSNGSLQARFANSMDLVGLCVGEKMLGRNGDKAGTTHGYAQDSVNHEAQGGKVFILNKLRDGVINDNGRQRRRWRTGLDEIDVHGL